MAFGNSVSVSSNEFEVQRSLNGLRLQEPRPRFDFLAYRTRTGARAPLAGEAAAHQGVPSTHDAVLLARGQHVVERPKAEPHAADDLNELAKLDAQPGHLAIGRARPFGRQH